jgi:hypothetical protein
VWRDARIGLYCEYCYEADTELSSFDPEFSVSNSAKNVIRLRVRNLNNQLHFNIAGVGISPSHFQANTFPDHFRKDITGLARCD